MPGTLLIFRPEARTPELRELDRPVRLDELQARRLLTNAIKLIMIESCKVELISGSTCP
jgi:hypothetical protein